MAHAPHRPRGPVQKPVLRATINSSHITPYPAIGASFDAQSFVVSSPESWADPAFTWESKTRVRASQVLFFQQFLTAYPSGIERLIASGRTPMLTFMPFTSSGALDADSVIAGSSDSIIQTYATGLAGRGTVRFAHEMNLAPSTSQPWGQMNAAKYVQMWQHVRTVWRAAETAAGKPHAPWHWCPNITGGSALGFTAYYPGDDQVEYVGLDAYAYKITGWPAFGTLVDNDLATISGFTSKPVLIGETACSIDNPNRAAWITGMFDYLIAHPNIKGFNWWDHSSTGIASDYRLGAFAADCAAFRAGVAAWAPTVS